MGAILDMVEDRSSGIPKKPKPGRTPDGRMYPPQEDSISRHQDGSITAETRGQLIEISAVGAIIFRSKRTGEVVFSEPARGPHDDR